ncbi:MAG: RNA-binding protein [Nitrospirales bacterium]|nr:RNA-binding protein [Nitrospirales bacterium]
MNTLLAIDCLPSQWTNDTLATLLSGFSGIRRSHVMANKDNRPLGFAT